MFDWGYLWRGGIFISWWLGALKSLNLREIFWFKQHEQITVWFGACKLLCTFVYVTHFVVNWPVGANCGLLSDGGRSFILNRQSLLALGFSDQRGTVTGGLNVLEDWGHDCGLGCYAFATWFLFFGGAAYEAVLDVWCSSIFRVLLWLHWGESCLPQMRVKWLSHFAFIKIKHI